MNILQDKNLEIEKSQEYLYIRIFRNTLKQFPTARAITARRFSLACNLQIMKYPARLKKLVMGFSCKTAFFKNVARGVAEHCLEMKNLQHWGIPK